jgi:hypothetical protein
MIQQFYLLLYFLKNQNQGLELYLYAYIHNGIIYNSQKVGLIQMSTYEWMNLTKCGM